MDDMDDMFEMCIDCRHAEHNCKCDDLANAKRYEKLNQLFVAYQVEWVLQNACALSAGGNCTDEKPCGPCHVASQIKLIREAPDSDFVETY